VVRLPDRRLAAVRARWIGFVFQQFFLTPHLSALDNVATGLLYHGCSRAADVAWHWPRWNGSGSGIESTIGPASCRAKRNNASRSPARPSANRACCWPTNPPAISTPPPALSIARSSGSEIVAG
jgi:hypothetical protein